MKRVPWLPVATWWRLLAVALGLVLVGLAGALVTPLPGEPALLTAVTEMRSPALTAVARAVTVAGDLWLVIAVGGIVAVVVRGSPFADRLRVLLVLSIGGSAAIVSILKLVVARPRPSNALVATLSPAYPSGHAIRATAVFGLLLWAAHHGIRRAALRYAAMLTITALMAAIAWSRVYLAVHLPSDVVVGLLLGAAWGAAVVSAVTSPGAAPGSGRS